MEAPYRHIAACVDGSPGSRLALAEAVRLRRLGPGRLSVVHAASWPLAAGAGSGLLPDTQPIFEAERNWLERLAADIKGAETVFLTGYAPWVVREWAAESGCDLLVASAHRGVFARLALGSFAGTLAYHAPCAVLLVRPGIAAEAPDEADLAAAQAR